MMPMSNRFSITLLIVLLSTGFLSGSPKGARTVGWTAAENKPAGQIEASQLRGTLIGLQYEPYFTSLAE
jgi:hypothetical protein